MRAPQEKGRVERAVRYVRDRFLAGREIHDVVQGNRELEGFLRDIAPARPHPRLPDCSVGDAFLEERPRLLALLEDLPAAPAARVRGHLRGAVEQAHAPVVGGEHQRAPG